MLLLHHQILFYVIPQQIWLVVCITPQSRESVILHLRRKYIHLLCLVRIRFKPVHCARFRSKSETLLVGTFTREWFRTFMFFHLFAQVSSNVLFESVWFHIGLLDLSLISFCISKSKWFLNFNRIDSVWTYLHRFGCGLYWAGPVTTLIE